MATYHDLRIVSSSRAFGSVQRYIQGPDELENVFEYGKAYGKNFHFVVDEGVFKLVKDKVEAIEDKQGCAYSFTAFSVTPPKSPSGWSAIVAMKPTAALPSIARPSSAHVIVRLSSSLTVR